MRKNNQKGVISLLTIFLLGAVSLFIGVSLLKTGFDASLRGRRQFDSLKAYYVANSGLENAFYKIQRISGYGLPGPETFNISVDSGTADVKVYGSENQRTIESVGKEGNFVRRIKVVVQNTQIKPGFGNAVLAGFGGVELRNNTIITGKNNTDGNIYSNSFVKGGHNSYNSAGNCKNDASKVDGSVYAVDRIDKLVTSDSDGVCVVKEAHSAHINYCWVKGDVFSPNPPSADCPYGGTYTIAEAPSEITLPDMGIDVLKNYLTSKGNAFAGDCTADGSNSASDCTKGTLKLGNIVITGNLTLPSNKSLLISGPVWVKGNVTINSLVELGLSPEITDVSQIFVTDGVLISDSNITYSSNKNAFLLFVSTFDPKVSKENVCNDGVQSAIEISSNANSVLFYAKNACIKIRANSTFHGATIGIGIRIDNNSIVEYDPALQTAIFGLTKEGGWQIISYKES